MCAKSFIVRQFVGWYVFFASTFCSKSESNAYNGISEKEKLSSSRKYWRAKYAAERQKRIKLAKRLKQAEKESNELVETIFNLTDIFRGV